MGSVTMLMLLMPDCRRRVDYGGKAAKGHRLIAAEEDAFLGVFQ